MSRLLIFCSLFFTLNAYATPKNVVVIIFENANYTKTLRQPFFNMVAQSGVLLTNYRGIAHPSQANYVAMVGGDKLGVNGDSNYDINASHLGDLLELNGKTWKTYAEAYPGGCYQGKKSGTYVRKHNPFISFVNIQNDPNRCANITSSASFKSDFMNRNLPTVSFYIPDMNNDGHDTGVAYADKWFAKEFGPLLQDANAMKDVLFVVVFILSFTPFLVSYF